MGPESSSWLARCLDKLGRIDEALELLQALVDGDDPAFMQRGRTDLDFLVWKRTFDRNLPAGMRDAE